MTAAQFIPTIINPSVVYKSYLKWLGMLLPGCKPEVQREYRSPRQFSDVELLLVGLLQPCYKLSYGADGNRLPEPVALRYLLGPGLQGFNGRSLSWESGQVVFILRPQHSEPSGLYIGEKGSKCKHILWTQNSTNKSKRGG